MLKLMCSILLAILSAIPCYGAGSQALPDWRVEKEKSLHAYVCRFEGELRGLRLGFGVGAQYLGGRGVISCIAPATGRHVHLPVKYRLLGAGLGYDLAWVRSVKITSAGFGAVASPFDLTGQFSVGASSGVTFVNRGINVQSAVSVKKKARGISFELGFQGEKAVGVGARLHGMVLWVKPLAGPAEGRPEKL
jgi:hypothetical protein